MALIMEDLSAPVQHDAHPRRDRSNSGESGAHKRSKNQQVDLELFRRVLSQRDNDDWNELFARSQGLVLSWAHAHPQYDLATRSDTVDSYIALTFERFWQATARNPSLTFSTLEAALSYLRACLNGAILDTLRSYRRPEVPFPGPDEMPLVDLMYEDPIDDQEIWDTIKQLLPAPREQRMAYLLFHCGLKPREIVHFCPDEFPRISEVYRLRRTLVERLLRHADWLRWQLRDEV